MREIYISEYADARLLRYLSEKGYAIKPVRNDARLGEFTGAHADLHMTKLGALPSSPVLMADERDFAPDYPRNAAYCAVCLDKYIIHRLDITAKPLKIAAESLGLAPIGIRQGYSKCSCVVVDGASVITSDDGIARALAPYSDIDVLKVSAGYVELAGFDTGFLGGASGRVEGEIVFNGDLSRHPDFEKICEFIQSRSLAVKYFSEYPLRDIGSIIEYSR